MILSICIYSIFSLYAAACIAYYAVNGINEISMSNNLLILMAGSFTYIVLRMITVKARDFFSFIDTFTHEYTHLIFSFITFSKVYSFSSTLRRGGEIKTKKLNPIIVLSPYTVPILLIMTGLLALIIKEQFLFAVIYIGGLFAAHFFHTSIKDAFFSKQPDMKIYGKYRSLMIIVISYIAILMFLFHTVNYSLLYNLQIFAKLYRGFIQ